MTTKINKKTIDKAFAAFFMLLGLLSLYGVLIGKTWHIALLIIEMIMVYVILDDLETEEQECNDRDILTEEDIKEIDAYLSNNHHADIRMFALTDGKRLTVKFRRNGTVREAVAVVDGDREDVTAIVRGLSC